jgi:type I restriction enzyme M protein
VTLLNSGKDEAKDSADQTPNDMRALPEKVVPSHGGGRLFSAGVPGNAGGSGAPSSALRARLRGSLAQRVAILEEIADDPTALKSDRIKAVDVLARYGLGAATELTVENVRERLGRTIDVLQQDRAGSAQQKCDASDLHVSRIRTATRVPNVRSLRYLRRVGSPNEGIPEEGTECSGAIPEGTNGHIGMTRRGRAKSTANTTAQSLGSLIKSARDIMRKDKGLNGDLDRLPLLTWIMFLKFLDDLEKQRENESRLTGEVFKSAIEAPYRWRDWAAKPEGITGDELLAFINSERAVRPDGSDGAGLFAYLRALTSSNGDTRRDVIATVFKGVDNRMKSGYLLRDVINLIDRIHFTSTEELHTLGALYESMLREMRDAAGDSGEFYTPRAVVRFMVSAVDPQLRETILDPATGTGGFLVEAFLHLSKQVRTVEEGRFLQTQSLLGCEPKPLPFLLAQMNLLLHGLDAPRIDPGNALRFKLTEIGERDRVDVILTNPPFGGEEERGIQGNFPDDKQTAETALLFLQLIMRRLRRRAHVGRPARAAVVVPNGTLFGDGVAARIKEELLREFNLHTIVRLPNGVFSPYTPIPTNILFFDRSRPSETVWYYEHPLPTGRKNYTKTHPLQFDEFRPCLTWWSSRSLTEHSWVVSAEELLATGCNLDRKNPRAPAEVEVSTPEDILTSIVQGETQILQLMEGIRAALRAE